MALIRKRVLVTGGAGFLGSHLCERLLKQGDEVLCVDNLHLGRVENIEHLRPCGLFHFIEADVLDRPAMEQIFAAIAEFLREAEKEPFQIKTTAAPLSEIKALWNSAEQGVRLVFQP